MNIKVTSLLLVLITLGFTSNNVHAQDNCPPRFCAEKSSIINRICKDLGDECESIYLKYNDEVCTCDCPTKSVLAIKSGKEWRSPEYPDSTIFKQMLLYVIYVELENDLTMMVLPKHLFLTNSGLKRADRLTPEDELLDPERNEIKITTLTSGTYNGEFSLIPMPEWNDDKNVNDHLINTFGVLSGDDFATAFFQTDSLEESAQLGTPEYYELIGRDKDIGSEDLQEIISLDGVFEFEPHREEPMPENDEDVDYFIDPDVAVLNIDNQYSLDKRVPQQNAKRLLEKFQKAYPNILFKLKWKNGLANASASIGRSGRKVIVNGALARNKHIHIEGLSLAVAHEVGHHLAGKPKKPTKPWSSCEDQADYWASLVCMRKIWPGPSVIQKIEAGGNQLHAFFARPTQTVTDFCIEHSHPDCRLEIYLAGRSADPMPACATR